EIGYKEYIVRRETDGKIVRTRILLILLYVLPFALLVYEAVRFSFYFLIIFLAVAEGCLILLTWPLTVREYEYVFLAGELSFHVIYGKRFRRKKTSVREDRLRHVVPATKESVAKYASGAKVLLDMTSGENEPHPYLLVFEDAKGRETAVLIAGYRQMIEELREKNFAVTEPDPTLPDYC
ncbi:MAG: hypothetical protein II797_01805, partial [Clostridia bacterium]|nr:hypothetical protein [Clostridia bacterium]